MQVYSGWPQLVRMRSSTTWYVAILGSCREKEGLRIQIGGETATPRARYPLPQASAEKPDFKNAVFRPWKSFQLVGQEAPEASEVLQGLGTHVKAA